MTTAQALPRSSPALEGVAPAAIARCLEAIQSQAGQELHSVMILRHGQVIAEASWQPYTPDQPAMLFSLSKSFTSTAIGFAVAAGLLTVDDPVLSFFPDEAPARPGKYWPELKVRHLLSMNTGHETDTTSFMLRRKDGDWVRGFLSRPLVFKPGTHFLYNTGATYMLSVIVQKLTGQRVLDYLQARLFEPLGIAGAAWEQCPRGYDTGGFGLSLTIEDIARFGQFLLQRGQWAGRQLLPPDWIDEATHNHSDNSINKGTPDWSAGYGYQFWRCVPDCFRGDGAFGQYCIVIHRLDTVIAMTSGVQDMQAVLTRIWEILLPGIGTSESVIADAARPDDLVKLETLLNSAAYEPPRIQHVSPLEAELSDKTWLMAPNRQRLKAVRLEFNPDDCKLTFVIGRKKVCVTAGRGQWLEGIYTGTVAHSITPRNSMPIAVSFTWVSRHILQLTIRDLGSPFVMTDTLVFNETGMTFASAVNVSFGPTRQPEIQGKIKVV